MVQRRRPSPPRTPRSRRRKERPAPQRPPEKVERVEVGIVRRPWGFAGAVAITQHSNDPDRLSPGTEIFIDGERYSIEESGFSGKSAVLKLSSVNTEEQAAKLRGKSIEMESSTLPRPPAGTYYHYQVLGARAVTVDGEELGTVAEILETGSNDVYVVRSNSPGAGTRPTEIVIPALKDVIVAVDVDQGTITVDLPEGLR